MPHNKCSLCSALAGLSRMGSGAAARVDRLGNTLGSTLTGGLDLLTDNRVEDCLLQVSPSFFFQKKYPFVVILSLHKQS